MNQRATKVVEVSRVVPANEILRILGGDQYNFPNARTNAHRSLHTLKKNGDRHDSLISYAIPDVNKGCTTFVFVATGPDCVTHVTHRFKSIERRFGVSIKTIEGRLADNTVRSLEQMYWGS